jgi:hypothetical protein
MSLRRQVPAIWTARQNDGHQTTGSQSHYSSGERPAASVTRDRISSDNDPAGILHPYPSLGEQISPATLFFRQNDRKKLPRHFNDFLATSGRGKNSDSSPTETAALLAANAQRGHR